MTRFGLTKEKFQAPGICEVSLSMCIKWENVWGSDESVLTLTAFLHTEHANCEQGRSYTHIEHLEGACPTSFDRKEQLYLLADIFLPFAEGGEEYRSQLDPAALEEEDERRKGLEALFDEEGDAERFYLWVVGQIEEIEDEESWEFYDGLDYMPDEEPLEGDGDTVG